MKNRELIAELQKHDPDLRVMIQQGEEYDYTDVESVKEQELVDMNSIEDDIINVLTIQYT